MRYNIIGIEENAKKFLELAIEEYKNLKLLWIGLTGKKKYPESYKILEELINEMRSLKAKRRNISLDEMDAIIKQCDAASRAVINEIEKNADFILPPSLE